MPYQKNIKKDRPDELLWGFEHLQNVLLGKKKFEAGVSVEELTEFSILNIVYDFFIF
jgi:hypothetical protein